MDGEAVIAGLSSSTGPDWLKDVLDKVGVRLKVHSTLKMLYTPTMVSYLYISSYYSWLVQLLF